MFKEQTQQKINLEYKDWDNNIYRVSFVQKENCTIRSLLFKFFGSKSSFLEQIIVCNQPLSSTIAALSRNNTLDLRVALSRPYHTDLRNPVKNIQEQQRLIAALEKEDAEVIILGVGTYPVRKGSEYQTDPAFASKLRARGHQVQIFNIDPLFQEQEPTTSTFGCALNPDYLLNSELVRVIEQKSAQGKKFIIFDNTSMTFSDFTYVLGKRKSEHLKQQQNIEYIIGHGLGSPLVMLSPQFFELFPSSDGLSRFKDAEELSQKTHCLRYETDQVIPVELLFEQDPAFQILNALEQIKNGKLIGNMYFYKIFLQKIKDVNTVDQLYSLLPVLDTPQFKKLVHFGDRVKTFFSQDVHAIEQVKNKMCLALTRILANPDAQVDPAKLKALCEGLEYSSDRSAQILQASSGSSIRK